MFRVINMTVGVLAYHAVRALLTQVIPLLVVRWENSRLPDRAVGSGETSSLGQLRFADRLAVREGDYTGHRGPGVVGARHGQRPGERSETIGDALEPGSVAHT
jgi:hypothetical protein